MKKFFQKMIVNQYAKKVQDLAQHPNTNRFLHAMDCGMLRQDILNAVFFGHITMAQGKELIKKLEEI